jgi:thiol-disulfide isomerase/thioredoxin
MIPHVKAAGLALLAILSPLGLPRSRGAEPLVGSRAQEWQVVGWLNSKPLARKDLAGKVILVRWWTAPGCPFCAATAPALNEFHNRYKEKGLVVIGFYHHKARAPLKPDQVQQSAQKLGFKFPVAIDPGWQTLRRWWLDRGGRRWTSVTFLIDRKGVIRHIHPGGQYVKGDRAYATLKARIEELLK